MSSVETGQMTAAETSVLSQQKTSVLSQKCPRLLLAAAGCHGPIRCQKALSFCVFELATRCFVRQGRRSVSPSIDFYKNFSHPSSASTPPRDFIGLLKSRQNPSVQAEMSWAGDLSKSAYNPPRNLSIVPCTVLKAPSSNSKCWMSAAETGQMSSVETRQMSQQQSSVLSQQQTSVLSQQKTSILSQQKI